MPFRRLPDSDERRLKALETCQLKKDATNPASWPISAGNATKLDAQYPQFNTAVGVRGSALSVESGAASGVGQAFNIARQMISHFIQTLNLAIDRHALPPAARAHYQLEVGHGAVPELSSHDDVLLWGDRLASGEAQRVATGGVAIPFPTIAEVSATVSDFKTKRASETTAASTLTADEQAVAALRPAVDALILDLWDEIGFAYRKDPPPTARAKAREWGVVYDTRPGEPPDAPPGTPPSPATPH